MILTNPAPEEKNFNLATQLRKQKDQELKQLGREPTVAMFTFLPVFSSCFLCICGLQGLLTLRFGSLFNHLFGLLSFIYPLLLLLTNQCVD